MSVLIKLLYFAVSYGSLSVKIESLSLAMLLLNLDLLVAFELSWQYTAPSSTVPTFFIYLGFVIHGDDLDLEAPFHHNSKRTSVF